MGIIYSKENVHIARKNASQKYLLAKGLISQEDLEMDRRVAAAVEVAIMRLKIMKKPIARYDAETGRAYLEYPN